MVDIIIGIMPTAKVAENPVRANPIRESLIDARILDIRPARKGKKTGPEGSDERRHMSRINVDPSGSTVLVLMINDANKLPQDLKTGDYRISIRISNKKTDQKAFIHGIKA